MSGNGTHATSGRAPRACLSRSSRGPVSPRHGSVLHVPLPEAEQRGKERGRLAPFGHWPSLSTHLTIWVESGVLVPKPSGRRTEAGVLRCSRWPRMSEAQTGVRCPGGRWGRPVKAQAAEPGGRAGHGALGSEGSGLGRRRTPLGGRSRLRCPAWRRGLPVLTRLCCVRAGGFPF